MPLISTRTVRTINPGVHLIDGPDHGFSLGIRDWPRPDLIRMSIGESRIALDTNSSSQVMCPSSLRHLASICHDLADALEHPETSKPLP